MILAADVGATKILMEAGEFRSGRWEPVLARRYLVDEFPEISGALRRFLDEWMQEKAARSPRSKAKGHGITAAAIGAAGPASGNRIKMTNRPWIIDGNVLARRFEIPRVTVVNDLAMAAYGIDQLGSRDFHSLQPGRSVADAPRVVLGVGTGLGVAYLVRRAPAAARRASDLLVLPGEGGHCGFSPSSARQADLWNDLFARQGRVESEQVVSGVGLTNIYEHLVGSGECPVGETKRPEPAWISAGAIERGDPGCMLALDIFTECLGNIAGEHAVALMAEGGVYLVGGISAKLAASLKGDVFRAAFCAKGVFSSALMRIPVRAVTNERLSLLGAARLAAL